MGWCSATTIFDNVAGALLYKKPEKPEVILENLIEALEDGDWDCQQESAYWDHPVVRKIMKKLHPAWFEGKGEK